MNGFRFGCERRAPNLARPATQFTDRAKSPMHGALLSADFIRSQRRAQAAAASAPAAPAFPPPEEEVRLPTELIEAVADFFVARKDLRSLMTMAALSRQFRLAVLPQLLHRFDCSNWRVRSDKLAKLPFDT